MYGPSSYIAARRTAPGNFGRQYPTSRDVGYKYRLRRFPTNH